MGSTHQPPPTNSVEQDLNIAIKRLKEIHLQQLLIHNINYYPDKNKDIHCAHNQKVQYLVVK